MPMNDKSMNWQVLDQDYSRAEVNREHAKRYGRVQRGSVRLVRGMYRTEAEQREFIQRGLSLRLPGQKQD